MEVKIFFYIPTNEVESPKQRIVITNIHYAKIYL